MLSILCNKKICHNNSSNNNNNNNKWCTRPIHDIRVDIQDGIQWRREFANTLAGTMGQTPSETDRQDTLSKNSRPIQHCALESGLITTRRWLAKCLTNNCMWTETWWWGRTGSGRLAPWGRNMGTSHMFLRSPNRRHRQPWLVMLSWLRPNSSS